MTAQSLVEWVKLDRDTFERLVEVLIVRKFVKDTGAQVVPLDGRGGDGGVDIGVWRDGHLERVLQLKFFPEGFSGDFRSRRRQIKRSFLRAIDKEPRSWTLVTPRNLTPGELAFVRDLGKLAKVEIGTPLGRGGLDSELALWPDLQGMFTRNDYLDTLRSLSLEGVALASAADLARAAQDLGARASAASMYWERALTICGTAVTQALVAKHPRAAELEPLEIRLSVDESALDPATARALGDLLGYGIGDEVALPAAAVPHVQLVGPEWFADEQTDVEVVLGRLGLPRGETREFELREVDADGASVRSWRGTITAQGAGLHGGHLTASVPGALTMTFRVPRGRDERASLSIEHSAVGAEPVAALRAFDLLRRMRSGATFELVVDGKRLVTFEPDGGVLDYPAAAYLEQLAGDLEVLEREFGLALRMPAEMSGHERETVRILRLALEGHCVEMPSVLTMTARLTGQTNEAFEHFLRSEPGVFVAESEVTFEVQGNRVRVQRFTVLVLRPHVVGGGQAIDALRDGRGTDFQIEVENADGSPFAAFIADRWKDPEAPLVPEPLEIEFVPH